MKEAYVYKDDKSHKFWTIDISGASLCVHYGKMGTIGKYEIKEFDTQAQCEKEAARLIASKKRKGYIQDETFDFDACIYIDSDEYGPHPKTSHPRFAAAFTEEFYYDCGDEEAPFGSDEGSDTLHAIEQKLRKNPKLDFAAFPKHLIEQEWGMRYIPVESLEKEAVLNLTREQEMDIQQSDMITYATAFAQIKTTGKLDPDLKMRGLMALKRFALMYSDGKLTQEQQIMYDDLSKWDTDLL